MPLIARSASIPPPPARLLEKLADPRPVVLGAFARGLRPPPRLTVSEWAAQERYVHAESGSPEPGKWSNDSTPYLCEIMDCLSPFHPAREVVFKKSHQVGGSEVGVNLFGYVVDRAPGPVMIVLPTVDEAKKYNRLKIDPTRAATPALRNKIREHKSRDEKGSTSLFKKFAGGFAVVTGANSSAGLQMISARFLILDEVTEYPGDVDGRGDPVDLALKRSTAHSRRRKVFYVSTPGIKGDCRIEKKYAVSDQRLLYVPCPQCGTWQPLTFKKLKWKSDRAPHGAYFVCAHGCAIEHHHKTAMVRAGRYVKTFEGTEENPAPPFAIEPEDIGRWHDGKECTRPSDGRPPGFAIWQCYSKFVHWDEIVADHLAVDGDHRKEKVFIQQVLGEPFEEKGDAPDYDRLFDRRIAMPTRRVPPGALFLVMAIDVQGNRIEFGVYAFGYRLTAWLIDKGVVEGDPADADFWPRCVDPLLDRTYEDAWGKPWPLDALGIDSGYLSQQVYNFVRRHAASGRAFALDGRPGWKLPAIGTPQKRDVDFSGQKIGTVMLWPVGTYDLKSEVYASLRKTIEGPDADGNWRPGAYFFGENCDKDYFRQLTAESIKDRDTGKGYTLKEWVKHPGQPNEGLDIAVYARGLAHHLSDQLQPKDWESLAARRHGPAADAQLDLARLWAPSIASIAAAPAAAPQHVERRPAAEPGGEEWLPDVGKDWL